MMKITTMNDVDFREAWILNSFATQEQHQQALSLEFPPTTTTSSCSIILESQEDENNYKATMTIEKNCDDKPEEKEVVPITTTSAAAAIITTATTTSSSTSTDIPTKYDVLCGQSRTCADHPGNQRFQAVLDMYVTKYQQATSKQEKMAITKETVQIINNSSGRFLKYDKNDNEWQEISTVMARDKVSHALRTKVAASLRKKKSQQAIISNKGNGKQSTKKTHRRRNGGNANNNKIMSSTTTAQQEQQHPVFVSLDWSDMTTSSTTSAIDDSSSFRSTFSMDGDNHQLSPISEQEECEMFDFLVEAGNIVGTDDN